MKYLLNGVAVAAALAIASPVWAQGAAMSPATPAKPAAPAAAAAAPAAPMPMAGKKQMHKRTAMKHKRGKRARVAAGDSATEQLNRDELARLQGGGAPMGAPPPAGPANAGAGQGGPRASGH